MRRELQEKGNAHEGEQERIANNKEKTKKSRLGSGGVCVGCVCGEGAPEPAHFKQPPWSLILWRQTRTQVNDRERTQTSGFARPSLLLFDADHGAKDHHINLPKDHTAAIQAPRPRVVQPTDIHTPSSLAVRASEQRRVRGGGDATNPIGDAHRCAHAQGTTKARVESTTKSHHEQRRTNREGRAKGHMTDKGTRDARRKGTQENVVHTHTPERERENEESTRRLRDEGGMGEEDAEKEANASTGDRRGHPATDSYSSACPSIDSIMKRACGGRSHVEQRHRYLFRLHDSTSPT